MKFVCSQSDLNTNLSLVGRVVPSRPTHPILGNVLLIADSKTQKISLRGFDLSLGIQTNFPAQVIEGGKITLPAKLLNDIVSRLNEGEITLTHEDEDVTDETEEGSIVTLTSTSGRYQLRSLSADEYPDIPEVEDGEALKLPISALSEGLRSSLFAASTEESKQVLTGIHLSQPEPGYLEFAATDGHRLAVVQTTQDDSEAPTTELDEDFAVTIPARALRELERILSNHSDEATLSLKLNESQVVFEVGDQRLTSRKLEGAYPAYQQLIPQQFTKQMAVERKLLIGCLERVSVLADQKNNVVKFELNSDNQQLSLSVDSADFGSAVESIPVQISGDSIEVAFNVKYLMDGLKALPTTEIQMQLNTPMQPIIFTPLGGVKMTYLVMPVQIRE
ncbi:MAG: DNA polymerase III subunit beta [Jaaginema sp. PMC 1079.18]|nr:DNA polymerase III subunit beta [Jaaginema sp. PMC 1080.18]MEC4852938.1 DNA polymerase III subunit beta [Jaaginema sp. PMC 1079.18]MEC4868800.1 DNA polymerase III subunit beta [Jaaginema sp. PMC 1078.18]